MHMTIFLLTLLAVDRYIQIVWNGLQQAKSHTKYRIVVGLLWVLSLCVCIPSFKWFNYDSERNVCYISWGEEKEENVLPEDCDGK